MLDAENEHGLQLEQAEGELEAALHSTREQHIDAQQHESESEEAQERKGAMLVSATSKNKTRKPHDLPLGLTCSTCGRYDSSCATQLRSTPHHRPEPHGAAGAEL